ncbi:MAG: hypothetical protein HZC23_10330 [Rhodocyclales bacterium]|nr:hypothetical protein [Rhodocyclales bacterium]
MKRLLPLLICLFAHAARAEAPAVETITPQERQQLLDQTKSLKSESSKLQSAAQQKRKEADVACWKKTLVSSCLSDAKREYLDSMAAARKLDVEAKQIERQVRERDRVTRRARQAEEAPKKQAATEKKVAKAKEQGAAQQQQREEKAAERERKAEQGSARARVQERQRQEKLETRRKKEEKAEQKALEREKKDKKRAEERAKQLERAQAQDK